MTILVMADQASLISMLQIERIDQLKNVLIVLILNVVQ
jgi:hypothetical protein